MRHLPKLQILTLAFLASSFLLFACQAKKTKTRPTFPTPPEQITDPTERANYILAHVWDSIPTLDTAAFPIFKEEEQFFVDYFAIATHADSLTTLESLKQFFSISTEPMYLEVLQIAQTYLTSKASQIQNEELYLMMLDEATRQELLDETAQAIYQDWRQSYLLNKRGTPAQDFTYQDEEGQEQTLYQTPIKGDYLMLYFYDPHCERCLHIMEQLTEEPTLTEALQSGRLTMLTIYPGRDQERWQSKLLLQPKEALKGIDPTQSILSVPLYEIFPIPAIYLLDSSYKVLEKQISLDELIQRLKSDQA